MKTLTLIVEGDTGGHVPLSRALPLRAFRILRASSLCEARRHLHKVEIDLILLDLQLSDGRGLDLVSRASDKRIPIIVVGQPGDVASAIRAGQLGASEYLERPVDPSRLREAIQRVIEAARGDRPRTSGDGERKGPNEILGRSHAIKVLRREIRRVAPTGCTVLIAGETGTGKELVAEWIHHLSRRPTGPLVRVNCGRFTEPLLERELFGHERGAFTDAREGRSGLFEQGQGGTIFLDEIQELTPKMQAKLLRVIEGFPFRRIGGDRDVDVDVRVLAAANGSLQAVLESGNFRRELYFRLNEYRIETPPLRDRPADVPLLARRFLRRFGREFGKGMLRLLPETERVLVHYSWPGNVRELKNVMKCVALRSESGDVRPVDLPTEIQSGALLRRAVGAPSIVAIEEVKRAYVEQVLERLGGNVSEASRVLGVSRSTLRAWLRRWSGPPRDTGR